jgi:predicted kinase
MWGLPGSGKSTRAKQMCRENGNLVRVNKDLLREMLLCSQWAPKKEAIVHKTATELVKLLLANGKDVVVDETSLNPIHEQNYKRIAEEAGASHEMVHIDTPVDECIRRDKEREARGERAVGKDVILNMSFQWHIYRSPKTCVVFDMDGTLANISHRLPCVRNFNNDPNWKKDWGAFFRLVHNDVLREDIFQEYVKAKGEGHDIIIVSGRPETVRKATEAWLTKHNIYPDRMIMRPASDSRDDTIIKQEIIDKYLEKSKIVKWYDDRPRVIRQVQSNGINVINVGGGVEF